MGDRSLLKAALVCIERACSGLRPPRTLADVPGRLNLSISEIVVPACESNACLLIWLIARLAGRYLTGVATVPIMLRFALC